MKIGVLAKETNVSRDTIRLYEKMGLLTNISRPYEYNNYKEYGEENVDRILMIKDMQKLGFTLKEGKELIMAIDSDSFGDEKAMEFMRKKLDAVQEKINELIKVKASLEAMLSRGCTENDRNRSKKLKSREVEKHSILR